MDKALGSDGFTGRFYKSCWNVIKGDLLMALDAIYRGHACDTPTTTEEAVSLSDEVIPPHEGLAWEGRIDCYGLQRRI